MKIASATLQMASTHAREQRHEVKESLKMWIGDRRPVFADEAPRRPSPADTVSLSEAAMAAQSADAINAQQEAAVEGDPKLILIRQMLELWLGHAVKVFSAEELQARIQSTEQARPQPPAPPGERPANAGFGIEYDRQERYSEFEQTQFTASGTVKTADGRELTFQLQLTMQRSYLEESNVSIRLGDAARKIDPLVLNFGGSAAQLSDRRFTFDLDADGRSEQISFVTPGSGFLVFDRNQDGRINDGRELFGPTSGDGFAELARLDDDGNGWIDESDAAFTKLQIWSRDGVGNDQLQSLATAGVGAITLARVATPFDIKNGGNEMLGQVRSSGIFLQENGLTGTIQQIDLTA